LAGTALNSALDQVPDPSHLHYPAAWPRYQAFPRLSTFAVPKFVLGSGGITSMQQFSRRIHTRPQHDGSIETSRDADADHSKLTACNSLANVATSSSPFAMRRDRKSASGHGETNVQPFDHQG